MNERDEIKRLKEDLEVEREIAVHRCEQLAFYEDMADELKLISENRQAKLSELRKAYDVRVAEVGQLRHELAACRAKLDEREK